MFSLIDHPYVACFSKPILSSQETAAGCLELKGYQQLLQQHHCFRFLASRSGPLIDANTLLMPPAAVITADEGAANLWIFLVAEIWWFCDAECQKVCPCRWPYFAQWGAPTFSWSSTFAMLAGAISAMVESVSPPLSSMSKSLSSSFTSRICASTSCEGRGGCRLL